MCLCECKSVTIIILGKHEGYVLFMTSKLDKREMTQSYYLVSRIHYIGTSLVVQWLRLCAFNARGTGLIPG